MNPDRPEVADVDPALPVGTVAAATLDGAPVAVVRHAGGWVAVPDACTHAACALSADGELFDGVVLACNCHGSEFDARTGEVLLGPADRPLDVVPLVVAAGRLRRAQARTAAAASGVMTPPEESSASIAEAGEGRANR